ncbi:hypothetical protein O6H91_Y344300 [Diphasiastrum complanatum]|nr:hypothetical protein O6H91_Y344300 [Diphasiastrum complanatum]
MVEESVRVAESVRMEEEVEMEVVCKALRDEDFLGSISMLSNGEDGALRCRFSRPPSLDSTEVPGRCDLEISSVRCSCSPQVVGDGTSVSIVLHNGVEIACEVVFPENGLETEKSNGKIIKGLSFLDRYLFVWIIVDMILAILLGYYFKGIKRAFEVANISSVSLPIAVGLWIMMYPVLCKVRYEVLGKMFRNGRLIRNLMLSLVLNWLVGPALMTGLAWATLPDLPHYRTGVILVGIARCIAMVLVWNDLAKGDKELCAVLVAVNSVLQILLYTPFALFYLKVLSRGHGIHVGTWAVAKSVLLFLGVPLAAGIITRYVLRGAFGKKWFEAKFVPFIGPWALLGLLYTIFVMFSIQAHEIVKDISNVVRVTVPLLLYFAIVFFSSVGVCRWLKIPYRDSVAQSFTASSNNFELAIAVAIGSFGIDSKEALAATIGPLIEVPVLIGLVYVMLYFRRSWSW